MNQYLRDALLVKERHRCAVVHGLEKVVFADIIAEPGIGFALAAQKRRAGKGKILGVGQAFAHVFGQRRVLRAVGFINNNNDIVTFRKQGIFLALVITELLNQRKNQPFVASQKIAHFFGIFRARRFILSDCISF